MSNHANLCDLNPRTIRQSNRSIYSKLNGSEQGKGTNHIVSYSRIKDPKFWMNIVHTDLGKVIH